MAGVGIPWRTVVTASLLGVALCVVAAGCGKKKMTAQQQARALESCRGSDDCVGRNLCVREKSGKKGVCVYPCKGPRSCFSGFRCTGHYVRTIGKSKVGRLKPYCQKADVAVGGACDAIGRGCKPGAACFAGTCVKTCSPKSGCAANQKCVPVYRKKDPYRLPWLRKADYRGCVPATIPHGKPCVDGKVPMCQPGHECLGGRCARLCQRDEQCPTGRKCHPFVAKVRKPLYQTALKTLFHACQPARLAPGAACQKNKWPLCKRGHRCLRSKCARLCQRTKDCGTTGKCIRITQSYGLLKKKKKTLYKACVPAPLKEGARCGKGVWERCQQGHRCRKGRCVRVCRTHEQCGESKACTGRGFFPKHRNQESLAKVTGAKGDYYFCRPGHRRFVPRATYNKCRSNRQCLPKHTCFRGKCRPFCQTGADCPKRLSVKVPCKTLRSKTGKKTWKVCLGLF